MKPSFLYQTLIHALVVVLALGLWKSCQKNNEKCDKYEIHPVSIEYKVDSIPYEVTLKAPEKPDIIIEVPVPQDVDTSKILEQYYAKHVYTRSYEDTNIKVTLKDTVSQNKLSQANLTYQLMKPTQIIINNEVVLKPVNKYFIGATLRTDTSLSINAYMLTKKEILIGAGYDPLSNVISASGAFRIFKGNRKRK